MYKEIPFDSSLLGEEAIIVTDGKGNKYEFIGRIPNEKFPLVFYKTGYENNKLLVRRREDGKAGSKEYIHKQHCIMKRKSKTMKVGVYKTVRGSVFALKEGTEWSTDTLVSDIVEIPYSD